VAKKKPDARLYERAAVGAQAQLKDLLYDAKLLVDLLPDVRDSVDKDGLPLSFILKKGRDRADAKARKESRWTPAQRQAASVRMKKLWAARRRAQKA
jgi:hypothetical protein